MSSPIIVTTSWDDGDPLDLRVAELLRARDLLGTFYVPIARYKGRERLTTSQLRSLVDEGFEVGGHTLTHKVLPKLSSQEIAREVDKDGLEDILGRPVRMFCYPKGRFNGRVTRQVKHAGYEGARTVRMLRQSLDFDPFQMPTSLPAYPNRKQMYARNLLKGRNIRGLFHYVTEFIRLDNWVSLGKILFDRVLREGGVWHLYGHSWQVEEMGLWDDLEEMLDYVSLRPGVAYIPNCDVIRAGRTQAHCSLARLGV